MGVGVITLSVMPKAFLGCGWKPVLLTHCCVLAKLGSQVLFTALHSGQGWERGTVPTAGRATSAAQSLARFSSHSAVSSLWHPYICRAAKTLAQFCF